MKNLNEQQIRDYMSILISEFNFTVMGIAKDTGIRRNILSAWFNNPDGNFLTQERLATLRVYVLDVLFGLDGLTPDEFEYILKAKEIKQELIKKRSNK